MSEIDEAARIAERVLDRPYADPDDDMAILARQTKRAAELRAEVERLRAALEAIIHVDTIVSVDMLHHVHIARRALGGKR